MEIYEPESCLESGLNRLLTVPIVDLLPADTSSCTDRPRH